MIKNKKQLSEMSEESEQGTKSKPRSAAERQASAAWKNHMTSMSHKTWSQKGTQCFMRRFMMWMV